MSFRLASKQVWLKSNFILRGTDFPNSHFKVPRILRLKIKLFHDSLGKLHYVYSDGWRRRFCNLIIFRKLRVPLSHSDSLRRSSPMLKWCVWSHCMLLSKLFVWHPHNNNRLCALLFSLRDSRWPCPNLKNVELLESF